MNKAQVMISRGALRSYPTEIFELADIRVAFEALTEQNPSTVAIRMNLKGLGEKVPVSAKPSHTRAPILRSILVSSFHSDHLVRRKCFISLGWMPRWFGPELHQM